MEATNPRAIINSAGRAHTMVIRFRKADGSLRRMVCRYDGAMSKKADQVVVWDFEKGAYRTVTLSRVEEVKVCSRPKPALRPAAEREARLEELRRQMSEIF